jgi:lipopolysaccharide export system protein LptA
MGFQTKTRVVQFLAPTLITQVGTKIYCEGGYYDTENDYAEFNLNPQYEREGQRGRAQKMRYLGASKEYILEDSAYVEEPAEQRVTKADLIRYNTEKETAVLVGNAYYRDSVQEVEGAEIRYFSREKRFQLGGRGRVSDPPNIIEADSLDFNEELGGGLAVGNVFWRDTAADFSILAWRMDYNKQSEYLNAFGAADAATGRPLMKILVEKDTLYMSADTLTAFKPDSTADSRVLLAHLDVRIFKSNLQAVCDSLRFSTADSIFWFYPLQNKPIIWSDTSQFSADTIRMAMRDEKVDRIWLRENALVVNSPDEQFYNQIKGRNNTIFFVDNEVDEMLVEGNAQAVYYALDDEQAYIGVNETACSEMRLFFGDNKVNSIRFYVQPDGKFTPMKEAGSDSIRLEGFFWETERRPRRLEDILLKKN